MQYYELGTSGIHVSALCLGGMSFGEPDPGQHEWTCDEATTQEIIASALEHGINFIDTANVYAHGTSEEFIGRALKKLGVPRDQVVLATKVYFNDGHLSAKAIEREIEGSLRRLDTDYVDLYITHRFDYDTPIEETLGALDSLVRAGKVRALGASEMYGYQYHNLQFTAQHEGLTPLSSLQCHHNLLYREGERELIPVARQYGALPTPYSPLASGHLARPTWDADSKRASSDAIMRSKYDSERQHSEPIVQAVAQVAQRHEVPMASVALAWQWAHGPASPIVGCSSPKRVEQAVAALDVKLSDDDITQMEELYRARPLVGPLARPGEVPLAGTAKMPAEDENAEKE